jgi:predicted nucleotidyltransferase
MLFRDLLEMQMDKALIPEIEDLLSLKEKTSELGLAPKRQVINDYIEKNLEVLKATIKEHPSQKKKSWTSLNEIFRQALKLTL